MLFLVTCAFFSFCKITTYIYLSCLGWLSSNTLREINNFELSNSFQNLSMQVVDVYDLVTVTQKLV